MLGFRTALVMLATACAANSALSQGTYYVDVNGTPPGTGTQGDPFTSIQYAHDQVPEFSTLLVAPGEYVENIDLTKRLTVRSTQGAETTVIRPAVQHVCVRLTGVIDDYQSLVVEGFTITGMLASGSSEAAVLGISGVLSRCIVAGNSTGFRIVYDGMARDCTIAHNTTNVYIIGAPAIFYGRNTVVWDGGNFEGFGGGVNASYCVADSMLLGGSGNPGNIIADPKLWNSPELDFRLRPGSPCIDAGDPASPHDPDGSRRDIGYFAYDATYAPGPSPYCTSKINSQGCSPTMQWNGAASATSAAAFTIAAVQELNNKSGLLFYGYAKDVKAFQGAWHCVKLPTKRTNVQSSGGNPPPNDCSGSYSFDFNARIQSGIDPALIPGTLIYAQYWSRDPGDAFQSALTDALYFGIAP